MGTTDLPLRFWSQDSMDLFNFSQYFSYFHVLCEHHWFDNFGGAHLKAAMDSCNCPWICDQESFHISQVIVSASTEYFTSISIGYRAWALCFHYKFFNHKEFFSHSYLMLCYWLCFVVVLGPIPQVLHQFYSSTPPLPHHIPALLLFLWLPVNLSPLKISVYRPGC